MRIKYVPLIVFFLICCFYGCNQEVSSPQDISNIEGKSNYLYIKDIQKQIVEKIEPTLLKAIWTQLKNNSRVDDAEKLHNTYDFSTGNILSSAKNTNTINKTSV